MDPPSTGTAPAGTSPDATLEPCPRCQKPKVICVCDRIEPTNTRTEVLVLQHPQEQDRLLGTANLTALSLPKCTVQVGLSWASLSHALDREAKPSEWGVLYTASLKKTLTKAQLAKPLVVLDRNSGEERVPPALEGIVVLDGTWSQAKALWWRNPWLLKLHRVLLHPTEPSAYGRLRKQPKRDYLSTIEATALALDRLGEDPELQKRMTRLFRTLCQRARDRLSEDTLRSW